MKGRKKSGAARALGALAAPVAVILAIVLFSVGLRNLSAGRSQEDLRQLEDVLRRGAVACYAADGVYPDSLEQLVERCGIQINEERYIVHYMAFGGNLLPDITVVEIAP